jgi:hypothetical protein
LHHHHDDEEEEEEAEDEGRRHMRTWRVEAWGETQSICSAVSMPVEGAARFHGFFSTIVTIGTISTIVTMMMIIIIIYLHSCLKQV